MELEAAAAETGQGQALAIDRCQVCGAGCEALILLSAGSSALCLLTGPVIARA